MVMVRVIPCLDVKDGRVVKGVNFERLRDMGDPVEHARFYGEAGADELVFLDVSATLEGRRTMLDVVRRVAEQVFIPLTVGGGVSDVEHVASLLRAGADKVGINSAAVTDPGLITRCAERFGSQCVVVAVDSKRTADGHRVFTRGGKHQTERETLAWIEEAVAKGAGEILLTSIDRDGTGQGFDVELLAEVRRRVRVPVVASGGAGRAAHFADAARAGADAVLAATLFHERTLSIDDVKDAMAVRGVAVRQAARVPVLPAGASPTFDAQGLLPAVLVDADSGEVLTLAYMNADSWQRTRATGETWLYSRSRGALWHKGATSGHTQQVVSLALDCDHDAVVVRVRPRGPACHEGWRSCFAPTATTSAAGGALVALDDVLAARAASRPAGSYTTALLGDENKREKKLGEELVELLRALHKGSDDDVVDEAADLFFHVAVALRARGVPLARVLARLGERAR
ncbi:MAG: imidazole glycerol phosphate synthase subunit HisF [Deltaproteobacteria bacterium]|nr:imidazole glycerol phosphate synthase subunit HisF [Deltaproteobacteria bacterium]